MLIEEKYSEHLHLKGESATRPMAHLEGRLASLLLLTGNDHASSSRLASRPSRRTPGRVQLRNLGSMKLAERFYRSVQRY